MLRGIDVSAVQGRIEWTKVAAAGIRFAIAKCAEGNRGKDPILGRPGWEVSSRRADGTSGVDPMWDRNVQLAREAGLIVGAYNFLYPLPPQAGNPTRDPEQQAKFHFDLCAGYGSIDGQLPPFADFEWPPPVEWLKWSCTASQLASWLTTYLQAADAYWGCPVGLYSYPDFWSRVLAAMTPEQLAIVGGRPLWWAEYPAGLTDWPTDGQGPHAPLPWTHADLWQFSGGSMTLPGGGPPTDCDVFMGTEDELRALTT